ncbi:MAG: glycosyltransferase family 9 protein [Candidatus Schekmanbacteria bacterium]|nr:glycosyltransferase family 9 protein [Candidatus Schekmanbacteria bacterium]
MGARICIVKLGALGDVLRTTTLLRGLHEAYPRCHLTWLTSLAAIPLLVPNRLIDRVLAMGLEAVLALTPERFDLVISLDKEPAPTGLAVSLRADRKVGFGRSPYGSLCPLNDESRHCFQMGFDDELKFVRNLKSYPQLVYEMAGLRYARQRYVFEPRPKDAHWARERLAQAASAATFRDAAPLVGLNVGAGPVYHAKCWHPAGFARLAVLLEGIGLRSVLLGGPDDRERMEAVRAATAAPVLSVGCEQDLRQFSGLVSCCDAIVTGDTLAMHLAIALDVPTVVLVGATSAQEIELYDRGELMVADYPCSPCYLSKCDEARRPPGRPHCLEAIAAETVADAVVRVLAKRRGRPSEPEERGRRS